MSKHNIPVTNPISELTNSFSAIRLNPGELRNSPLSSKADSTDKDVGVLELESDIVQRDDACFGASKKFARRWDLPQRAVQNHITLACGRRTLPAIMLLNPSCQHEDLPFDKMVQNCPTLRWLSTIFRGLGIDLEDVIILDMCTLLSDSRLAQLTGTKEKAMHEAFVLTSGMLATIKPSTVVVCQCSTRYSPWADGGHNIARELCSSVRMAQNRCVKTVYVETHPVCVVPAYHPSMFLNYSNGSLPSARLEASLRNILQEAYRPALRKEKLKHQATLANNLISGPRIYRNNCTRQRCTAW